MSEITCTNTYVPLPPQAALRRSTAKVRGYGGAMAGGKTRALCEETWDLMLDRPGIMVPIIRQKHTAITLTTRKLFLEQVVPPEIRHRRDLIRTKQSQGEDWLRIWNGSEVHFAGLDDPGKWFSSEIGGARFDEAHEIDEEDVLTINSRLRQRCPDCVARNRDDCPHYPRDMILAFNPMEPGHWLQRWFIYGAQRTEFGYRKDELIVEDGIDPLGDCEFFISRPADNPHLPSGYVERTLAGLKPWQRRRYLDGMWEHIGGHSIFDSDALGRCHEDSLTFRPFFRAARAKGDLTGADTDNLPAIIEDGRGEMEVYRPPVRTHVADDGNEVRAHRYVVAVDASSGLSSDYSAVQVVDVDELEQVVEWQGKVDPDKLAEIAFLTACVYNGALLVPEITGGWGFAVVKRVQAGVGAWKGKPEARPKLYTRPIVDRLSQRFTDLLGWDTNTKSRAQMIDVLEESLRDGSLTVHGTRTLTEMGAFVLPERVGGIGEYRSPRARKGSNDDLVIALAIGVTVAVRQPKQLQRVNRPQPPPVFGATGY